MNSAETTKWWTPERVDLLKGLLGEGKSAAIIAAEMGASSRNAILGKVHRLGLTGGGQPKRCVKRQRRTHTRPHNIVARVEALSVSPQLAPEAIVRVTTRLQEPDPLQLSIYQLCDSSEERAGTCKWPVTDEPPHCFCGHPSFAGHPYCDFHQTIAHAGGGTAERSASPAAAA